MNWQTFNLIGREYVVYHLIKQGGASITELIRLMDGISGRVRYINKINSWQEYLYLDNIDGFGYHSYTKVSTAIEYLTECKLIQVRSKEGHVHDGYCIETTCTFSLTDDGEKLYEEITEHFRMQWEARYLTRLLKEA